MWLELIERGDEREKVMDAAGQAGTCGHVRTWPFTPRAWLWADQGHADSVLCSQEWSDGFREDGL